MSAGRGRIAGMNTREKLIVYGGGTVMTVMVVALAATLIYLRHFGDIGNLIFPPNAGLRDAYQRLGGALLTTVVFLVAVTYWGKTVQRIKARDGYVFLPPRVEMPCPMCGAKMRVPGRCPKCGENVVNVVAPSPDAPSESN